MARDDSLTSGAVPASWPWNWRRSSARRSDWTRTPTGSPRRRATPGRAGSSTSAGRRVWRGRFRISISAGSGWSPSDSRSTGPTGRGWPRRSTTFSNRAAARHGGPHGERPARAIRPWLSVDPPRGDPFADRHLPRSPPAVRPGMPDTPDRRVGGTRSAAPALASPGRFLPRADRTSSKTPTASSPTSCRCHMPPRTSSVRGSAASRPMSANCSPRSSPTSYGTSTVGGIRPSFGGTPQKSDSARWR